MIPFLATIRGVGTEIKAIARVIRLTRPPFWFAAALLFPISLAGTLVGLVPGVPGQTVVVLQGIALLFWFGIGFFSGRVAGGIRRRHWVQYPQGPDVHPYLPQLITVLAAGPFFLAMGVFFLAIGRHLPETLPVHTPADACLRVVDQILHGGIFFDSFEIYHLALTPRPSHVVGKTVILVTRILTDLVFVKLFIQILRAALHRARDLARGEDVLLLIYRAIAIQDEARVAALSQQCRDSLCNAVDDLLAEVDVNDTDSPSWQCLAEMSEFAIPYMRSQATWKSDAECQFLTVAIERLEATRNSLNVAVNDCLGSSPGFSETEGWATLSRQRATALRFLDDQMRTAPISNQDPLRRLARALRASDPASSKVMWVWRTSVLAAIWIGLSALIVASYVCDGIAALALSGGTLVLLGWIIVRARSWTMRFVNWDLICQLSPQQIPWFVLAVTVTLTPLLIADAARLFQICHQVSPGIFGVAPGEHVDIPSTTVYVLDNILRTQVFIDTFEVYGIHVSRLVTHGALGCSLTMVVRLIFDLGVIGLLLSFAAVWFDRLFRRLDVTPNAELSLRSESRECGPQSPMLIHHYFREVRDFFLERMREHEASPEIFVSLVPSGFLSTFRSQYDRRETHGGGGVKQCVRVGALLRDRLRLRRESKIELAHAWKLLGEVAVVAPGEEKVLRAELCHQLAYTLWYLNDFEAAIARAGESIGLYQEMIDEGASGLEVDLAWAKYVRGVVYFSLADYPSAIAEYALAIDSYEQARANAVDGDARLEHERKLALAYGDMGTTQACAGQASDAIGTFEKAIELLASSEWENTSWAKEDLATYYSGQGTAFAHLKRKEDAAGAYARALHVCREMERGGLLEHPRIPAIVHVNIGVNLLDTNQTEKASAEFHEAIAYYEKGLRRGYDELRSDYGSHLVRLGQCLSQLQQLPAAEDSLIKAREVLYRLVHQEARGDLADSLAAAYFNLGLLRKSRGKATEAIAQFSKAVREYDRVKTGDMQGKIAEIRVYWAETLSNCVDMGDALSIVEQATPVLKALVDEQGRNEFCSAFLRGLTIRGIVNCRLGKWRAAITCLEDVLLRYEKLADDGDEIVCYHIPWSRFWLAESFKGCNQAERARQEYQTAYEEFTSLPNSAKFEYDTLLGSGRSGYELGLLLVIERPLEAVQVFQESLSCFQRIQDGNLGDVGDWQLHSLCQIGTLHFQAGAKSEARTSFRRASKIVEGRADMGDWSSLPNAVQLWRAQFQCAPSPHHVDAQLVLESACGCLNRWHNDRGRFSEQSMTAIRQFLTEASPIGGSATKEIDRTLQLYSSCHNSEMNAEDEL